jgi:hypothetical protein
MLQTVYSWYHTAVIPTFKYPVNFVISKIELLIKHLKSWMVGTPASYMGDLEFDCLHGHRLPWKRCRGVRQSLQDRVSIYSATKSLAIFDINQYNTRRCVD